MSIFPTLDMLEDEGPHALLEPSSPAYTNLTIRRAFIVWMYCGQKNQFRDVCNYYHHLEALENKLQSHQRAQSRHCEIDMFSHQPPCSTYLRKQFPKLYSELYVKPEREEQNIFKLHGFKELKTQNGATADEIVKASQMIRLHCKTYSKSIKKFLLEFKEYAKKCELNYTVNSVVFYLKRNMIGEELTRKTDRKDEDESKLVKETIKPTRILKRPSNVENIDVNDVLPRSGTTEYTNNKIDYIKTTTGIGNAKGDTVYTDSESACVFGILAKSISLESLLQSEDEECMKLKTNQEFSKAHLRRTDVTKLRKI